ncbi:MAG: hypothetical protein LBL21_00420 [Rickettsiales bacterium]|jgi:hypothetical protein|nr:hypothetical protein [Rickettsiales bacterium]
MAQYSDYQDFVFNYFKQAHLDNMDAGRRARLDALRGRVLNVNGVDTYPDDKRNTEQKSWHFSTRGPNGASLLPDINRGTGQPGAAGFVDPLDGNDAIEFYRKVRTVLRNMEKEKNTIDQENPGLSGKWAKFFAYTDNSTPNHPVIKNTFKPFNPAAMLNAAGNPITNDLRNLINFYVIPNGTNSIFATTIAQSFAPGYSINKFINDYNHQNYSEQFLDQLDRIMNQVNMTANTAGSQITNNTPGVRNFFAPDGVFYKLIKGLDQENEQPDTDLFFDNHNPPQNGEANYKALLDLLSSNEDFRKQFSKHGGEEIAGLFDHAKANTNYDVLDPKLTDKKWPLEQARDNLDKVIKERLAKLGDNHMRHKYSDIRAHGIVEAINKLQIKQQDGLGKVMENAEKIKTELDKSNPNAAKMWKVFTTIMGEAQTGMPDAFAGALKNGSQMRAVVQYAISRAVNTEGKKEEAKVVLEVLSVLRYGTFTSDRWEEWKKNPLKMWDGVKEMNEGFLKWFAVGSNWAVNRGVDAIFWAGHFANRTLQMQGAKFKDAKGKKLGALEQPINDYRNAANAADQAKYKDITDLMAFWDYLTTGAVIDKNPLRKHSKEQEKHTDNVVPNFQGTVFNPWKAQYGY